MKRPTVETVRSIPVSSTRGSKFKAHYAAALAGKIVVLPVGSGQPGLKPKKLGLKAVFRDGRYYIFKPKQAAKRRRSSK